MTNTEIIDNNRLIAEFMGLEKHSSNEYLHKGNIFSNDAILYHASWEWLMPVVSKISNEKGVKVDFAFSLGALKVSINKCGITSGWPNPNHIEAVYKTVIDFIKWHNSQS